jgi:hypothetical protein
MPRKPQRWSGAEARTAKPLECCITGKPPCLEIHHRLLTRRRIATTITPLGVTVPATLLARADEVIE